MRLVEKTYFVIIVADMRPQHVMMTKYVIYVVKECLFVAKNAIHQGFTVFLFFPERELKGGENELTGIDTLLYKVRIFYHTKEPFHNDENLQK